MLTKYVRGYVLWVVKERVWLLPVSSWSMDTVLKNIGWTGNMVTGQFFSSPVVT